MAPLSRVVHLAGMGLFAVFYGVVRAALLFAVDRVLLRPAMPLANFGVGAGRVGGCLGVVHRSRHDDRGAAAHLARRRVRSSDSSPRACCWSSPASTTASRCCRRRCSGSPRSHRRHTRWKGYAQRSSRGRASASSAASSWRLTVFGVVIDPARPGRLPARRALREAARQAEAVRLRSPRAASLNLVLFPRKLNKEFIRGCGDSEGRCRRVRDHGLRHL